MEPARLQGETGGCEPDTGAQTLKCPLWHSRELLYRSPWSLYKAISLPTSKGEMGLQNPKQFPEGGEDLVPF